MLIINLLVIALIIVGTWYGIRKYLARNKPQAEQPVINPFTKPSVPRVVHSKFFPDNLYVSKVSKLDSTIQYLFDNLLFAFPTDPLIVKDFKSFNIDDNEFEEVVFDKIGPKNYIALIDAFEDNIYFLNRVTSITIPAGEVPPMVCQDVIEMEEGEHTYEYVDMSGLIQVSVTKDGVFQNERLIRVYERPVNENENEYLVCIQDKPDVVDYYLGFNIKINQLQDL